jgi:hypothetical protein
MSNLSSSKCVAADSANPLNEAGILQHVLNILGPWHHLFISAVSKAWNNSYEQVASVQMAGFAEIGDCYEHTALHTITSKTTVCSAVFACGSRVKLAHQCGLTFGNEQLQRVAGKVAAIPTLRAAHELGLELSDQVLSGAAQAAALRKLQWLHTKQGCPLNVDTPFFAARGGSIDMLRWVKGRGCVFGANTCTGAAARAHIHVLQFLREEGCAWDSDACVAAAQRGNWSTLKWPHEQGCLYILMLCVLCDTMLHSMHRPKQLLSYVSMKYNLNLLKLK